MNDLFARSAIALEHLLSASTVHGPAKEETLRIIAELRDAPDNFGARVEERVRALAEQMDGRVTALEAGKRHSDAVVFSNANAASLGVSAAGVSDEERARLRDLFNGADPAAFDHDGNGQPGGSVPSLPTPEPTPAPVSVGDEAPGEMTVAELKAALDDKGIGYPSSARKADLQALLDESDITRTGDDTLSGT